MSRYKKEYRILHFHTKNLEQSKEIQENWTRQKKFDIWFCIIIWSLLPELFFCKGERVVEFVSTQFSWYFLYPQDFKS